MSILIKDMEMPTRCGRFDMCVKEADGDIDYHYACCITAAVIKNLGEKMEDCPLVPVPPHGRLIDADALVKKIGENIDKAKDRSHDWWYACTVAYDFALAAPTIIEAEEGEDDLADAYAGPRMPNCIPLDWT